MHNLIYYYVRLIPFAAARQFATQSLTQSGSQSASFLIVMRSILAQFSKSPPRSITKEDALLTLFEHGGLNEVIRIPTDISQQ